MIRPYLSDIINYHKFQRDWKVNSGHTVIDYKTQGEWTTQLSMTIDFISSKDSDKIRTMHTKSHNIEIMKQMILLKSFLNLFCKRFRKN